MSDTLSLATRLREMDDARLAASIRARDLRVGGIKDFFDLADALLDRASIQHRLSRLDRGTLATIAAIAEIGSTTGGVTVEDVAAHLTRLGADPSLTAISTQAATAVTLLLAETESSRYAVYASVIEQLRSWPAFGLPSLTQLATSAVPLVPVPASATDLRFIDRVASERAFAATTEIAELLVQLEREPARELAKGGVALPDTKRLAHAMSVDLESVGRLLAIAADAGLVARENGSWLITDAGGSWLLESSGSRWGTLAAGWISRLPGDIRALLSERGTAFWGDDLRSFLLWLYPAGSEWMGERISTYTRAAEVLGVTANQAPSGPGAMLLTKGPDAAAEAMGALLVPEVEQVYLQHDLSVVAPGPLTPRVDYRLRSLADIESRALASSYRVSTSSMNRAMASGETADSVREFLASISLTGIPQPLDYLITEASARYGLLRAGEILGGNSVEHAARSYLRSDDAALLGTVMVDQNLSVLGLVRVDTHRLVSRFALDTVFWNLSDARYPVAAENAQGEIVALVRRRHARSVPAIGPDPVDALIERLRLGNDESGEQSDAWLHRQLDVAIKAKVALTVSVIMPNGAVVDYQLEPTSVAGGRLRARDRRSAIERTLPMASIASIAPASDH